MNQMVAQEGTSQFLVQCKRNPQRKSIQFNWKLWIFSLALPWLYWWFLELAHRLPKA